MCEWGWSGRRREDKWGKEIERSKCMRMREVDERGEKNLRALVYQGKDRNKTKTN